MGQFMRIGWAPAAIGNTDDINSPDNASHGKHALPVTVASASGGRFPWGSDGVAKRLFGPFPTAEHWSHPASAWE